MAEADFTPAIDAANVTYRWTGDNLGLGGNDEAILVGLKDSRDRRFLVSLDQALSVADQIDPSSCFQRLAEALPSCVDDGYICDADLAVWRAAAPRISEMLNGPRYIEHRHLRQAKDLLVPPGYCLPLKMPDDSMYPRIKKGGAFLLKGGEYDEAESGDDVLVIFADNKWIARTLVAQSDHAVTLATYNPPAEITVARSSIAGIYFIDALLSPHAYADLVGEHPTGERIAA